MSGCHLSWDDEVIEQNELRPPLFLDARGDDGHGDDQAEQPDPHRPADPGYRRIAADQAGSQEEQKRRAQGNG